MNHKKGLVIDSLDLSIEFKENRIPCVFDEDERQYESIGLEHCKKVEFIPLDLLQSFPNLKELSISHSGMVQVPKTLFTADLKMLRVLCLDNNETERIDVEAFAALTELKEISLKGNEIDEIPHKLFEKNLKLEKIIMSDNLIHSLHPELFDGLINLKEVDLMNNLRFSKKFGQENILKLKEELKPLFDSYIKKYGKEPVLVPVEVPKWLKKFEKFKIEPKKYSQSTQELQATKAQLKTSEYQSIDNKISSELLKNYEKLKDIDGDIVLEFQDGKHLKAHRAVLIGEF
jgi:Leucine-rich repeat (LRR) protein